MDRGFFALLCSAVLHSVGASGQTQDHSAAVPGSAPRVSIQFDTCTAGNSYLEAPIQKMREALSPEWKSQGLNTSLTHCILASMRKPVVSGRSDAGQLVCATADSPRRRAAKQSKGPCASQAMVGYLSVVLANVARCTSVDPRELFALWSHESRFSPSAVSPSGAGGVAQLTGGAIKEVNQWIGDAPKSKRARSRVATLNDPMCKQVSEQLAALHEHPDHTCARLAMPPNPIKNMAFAAVYYRDLRNTALSKLSPAAGNEHLDRWLGRLGDEHKQIVVQELTRAMYNGGPTEIGAKIDTFVASFKADEMILAEFKTKFRSFLGTNTEPGNYSRKIDGDMNKLGTAECALGATQ